VRRFLTNRKVPFPIIRRWLPPYETAPALGGGYEASLSPPPERNFVEAGELHRRSPSRNIPFPFRKTPLLHSPPRDRAGLKNAHFPLSEEPTFVCRCTRGGWPFPQACTSWRSQLSPPDALTFFSTRCLYFPSIILWRICSQLFHRDSPFLALVSLPFPGARRKSCHLRLRR